MALAVTMAAGFSFVAGEQVGVRIGEGHGGAGLAAVAVARAAVPGDDGRAGLPPPPAVEEPGGVGADCNTQVR